MSQWLGYLKFANRVKGYNRVSLDHNASRWLIFVQLSDIKFWWKRKNVLDKYLKLRMVGPPCSSIASFSLRGCPFSSSTTVLRTVNIGHDPGSGMSFFLDLGSRVLDPKPTFQRAYLQLLGLKYWNSINKKSIGTNFLRLFKKKIIFNFVTFMATKKVGQKNSPLFLIVLVGPGRKKIRIRDPG